MIDQGRGTQMTDMIDQGRGTLVTIMIDQEIDQKATQVDLGTVLIDPGTVGHIEVHQILIRVLEDHTMSVVDHLPHTIKKYTTYIVMEHAQIIVPRVLLM